MAHLAIQGHATRGNEVIELLKMMGGDNCYSYTGTNEDYYAIDNGRICRVPHCVCIINQWTMYSLNDFLKKYPYKVGDKVNSPCRGCIKTITSMKWDDYLDTITYKLNDREYTNIAQLKVVNDLPLEQKPMEEKKINQMSLANCDLDEVEIVLGDKFEMKIKNGKYYAVHKKPQYPKTYVECCEVLGIGSYFEPEIRNATTEECHIFMKLINLKRCRDAYWKIAGDWEPDWNNIQDKHCIYVVSGELWLKECQTRQCPLAFPTAEMRDAFYENFKDLIEQCKELL